MYKRKVFTALLFFLAIATVSSSGTVEVASSDVDQDLRIVSLGPNITETVFALGKGNLLVGRTNYCDYPEEAKQIQSVGDLYNPSIETIVSLKPDVIVCSSIVSTETVAVLQNAGLSVAIVNPQESLEGTYELIETVGTIIGAEKESVELCSEIRERIFKVESTVSSNVKERKTVYYCVGFGEMGDFTATGDTFISGVIDVAGGENVAKDGRNWIFDKESLFIADPDVILIPVYSYSNPEGDINYLTSVEPYSNLSACKSGEIKLIDGNIMDRQGPRIADAVEEVARILYPEVF